jgi:hypothetical protein
VARHRTAARRTRHRFVGAAVLGFGVLASLRLLFRMLAVV